MPKMLVQFSRAGLRDPQLVRLDTDAKMSEDLDDITALAKAQRKRQRALEELDAVKLSAEEKRKAEQAINAYYDDLETKAKETDDKKLNEEKLKLFTFDKEVEKYCYMWRDGGQFSTEKYKSNKNFEKKI